MFSLFFLLLNVHRYFNLSLTFTERDITQNNKYMSMILGYIGIIRVHMVLAPDPEYSCWNFFCTNLFLPIACWGFRRPVQNSRREFSLLHAQATRGCVSQTFSHFASGPIKPDSSRSLPFFASIYPRLPSLLHGYFFPTFFTTHRVLLPPSELSWSSLKKPLTPNQSSFATAS